jgi:hypothetical protein
MIRMSDQLKRRLILLSSAPLPRPLRVSVRQSLLTRLELGKGRRGQVCIIGHPKSGNTWLRTMISRLYHVRYGLPTALILKSDELANSNPAIPKFLVTNGYYSYEGIIGKVLAADQPRSELHHKKIILLARHPCDIAVSWYFQFTKRVSAAKRELINASLSRPIDHTRISMWDFVMQSEIGLPFLIDYLNTWQRNLEKVDHSLLVRYEDLRTSTAENLQCITAFIGESFTVQEIQDAVAFTSFDNLRQLETSGLFGRGGLSRRNLADPDSFKVRRGKVGGYRDYFTAEQVAQMEELVWTQLSPVFGYGTAATIPAAS